MIMTTSPTVMEYVTPGSDAALSRRWSRLALAACAWCVLSPLLSVGLLFLADGNRLPQHFLCCKHPEVAALVFILMPAAGAVAGVVSIVRLRRQRPWLKGWPFAIAAVVIGAPLALAGAVVLVALKA